MNRVERRVRELVNPYSTSFTHWWCHSGRRLPLVRTVTRVTSAGSSDVPGPMAPRAEVRFVSPERRWRAGFMVLPAAFFGWRAYHYLGPVAGYVTAAVLLSLAAPIMRTCLIVTDGGVIDRRAVRTVRVSWHQVGEFRVERPGWLWGGFCVIAACKNGTQIDLLSTRAYTRAPSERHLDELHRLCWTLQELLSERGESLPSHR